jgi:hypothetical protein
VTALIVIIAIVAVIAVGSVGVALFVGWSVYTLVRAATRLVLPSTRDAPGPSTAPLPVVGAAEPAEAWLQARDRFHHVRAEYAAYECDPMRVLNLPALADVSVPSTARFVDAFAEAQGLETDAYPGPAHAPAFTAAADRAERTWAAAQDAASRIRLSGLDPDERAAVERIIKLLTTARDSDSEPERLTAYSRARSELAKLDRAGVIHLPPLAQAALDADGRGQLPRPQPEQGQP